MDYGKENSEELIFETRAGFTIKINPYRKTCNISRGGQIETARGSHGSSIHQEIPFVLFIGRRFEILIRTGEYFLVNVREGKALIPYKMWPEKDVRNLLVGCGTMCDQFPIFVNHFETVKQFEEEQTREVYQFVFFDPDISNYQKMTFSIKNPAFKKVMVLSHKKEAIGEDSGRDDANKPEENELKSEPDVPVKSQNPVFQARIYLRNKEPEKVKQMLMEYALNPEDIHIIRAFISSMLEEGEQNTEIRKIKAQLKILNELLRLHSLMTDRDKTLFENELEKGLSAAVAIDLIPIVEQLRIRAGTKEDEIVFWEWEYRLGKMTGMKVKSD